MTKNSLKKKKWQHNLRTPATRAACPLVNQHNSKPTKATRGAGCPGHRARPTVQQGAGCKRAGRSGSVLLLESPTFDLRSPQSQHCTRRLGSSGRTGAKQPGPRSQLLPVSRRRKAKASIPLPPGKEANPLKPGQAGRVAGRASSPDGKDPALGARDPEDFEHRHLASSLLLPAEATGLWRLESPSVPPRGSGRE